MKEFNISKELIKDIRKNQELPRHLREKENYKPIQKKLFGMLQSTHSHAEIMDWINCFPCQQRYKKFKEEKKRLGFKSSSQFMKWEKMANISQKYD